MSIHRKHHAKVETEDDPHSPTFYGINKVILQGADLYHKEKNNKETIEKYKIDFTVVNGENASDDGKGITKEIVDDFF